MILGSAKPLDRKVTGRFWKALNTRLRLSCVVFKAWYLMSGSEARAENRQN